MAKPVSTRLLKELAEVKTSSMSSFRNVSLPDDSNMMKWEALVVPEKVPYNKGAFRVEMVFPSEYPFKPPKINFLTGIYHPNVDEKGQVCLSIISPENWKPATKVVQVIEALVNLVNDPQPDHPLRADLAKEFQTEKKKFMQNAEAHTKKHAEKRPN